MGASGVTTTPPTSRAASWPRCVGGKTRSSINAARKSRPDALIEALSPKAATAVTHAEVVNPPKVIAGGARPVANHAAAMARATAKSGTGSSNQAIAPPSMTSAMCQPALVRPCGAGSSQSAAGTPMAKAIERTRERPERRACGAAIIARRGSAGWSGAPTLVRSRRSIALARPRAMARPSAGRSRSRRSKCWRGIRHTCTSVRARTVAVR